MIREKNDNWGRALTLTPDWRYQKHDNKPKQYNIFLKAHTYKYQRCLYCYLSGRVAITDTLNLLRNVSKYFFFAFEMTTENLSLILCFMNNTKKLVTMCNKGNKLPENVSSGALLS